MTKINKRMFAAVVKKSSRVNVTERMLKVVNVTTGVSTELYILQTFTFSCSNSLELSDQVLI